MPPLPPPPKKKKNKERNHKHHFISKLSTNCCWFLAAIHMHCPLHSQRVGVAALGEQPGLAGSGGGELGKHRKRRSWFVPTAPQNTCDGWPQSRLCYAQKSGCCPPGWSSSSPEGGSHLGDLGRVEKRNCPQRWLLGARLQWVKGETPVNPNFRAAPSRGVARHHYAHLPSPALQPCDCPHPTGLSCQWTLQ